MKQPCIIVIGGGAAGFFGAIRCAQLNPKAQVTILEATQHPLAKVRISGGGRCNVTHACFDPGELAQNYPRGSRELLGPMHRFGPRETVDWFATRNVRLKTEPDGRMFPVTDSSATIVNALLQAAADAGVELRTGCQVKQVSRNEAGVFQVNLAKGRESLSADRILLASGGSRGTAGVAIAKALGHTIEPQVPSLFTFHIEDSRIKGLAGIAATDAEISVPKTKLRARGPILVTHWGLSGPATLKLSALGARTFDDSGYKLPVHVRWAAAMTPRAIEESLIRERQSNRRSRITKSNPFKLPARLWERLVEAAGIDHGQPWSTVSNSRLNALGRQVSKSEFHVTGKSMNKEEFVTCGGVRLREVDFKTMESRTCPGLHMAGEILDIDGVTGGFNFQAAWTTGWLAGTAMASGQR